MILVLGVPDNNYKSSSGPLLRGNERGLVRAHGPNRVKNNAEERLVVRRVG